MEGRGPAVVPQAPCQEGVSKKQFCCWMMPCGLKTCQVVCYACCICHGVHLFHVCAVLASCPAAHSRCFGGKDHCTPHACNLRGTTLVVDQTPLRALCPETPACRLLATLCNRCFCSTPGRALPALPACRGQHPAASILLRLRGGETHLRTGVTVRPGSLRLIPRLRGPTDADCGGCSHHAQCHSRWGRSHHSQSCRSGAKVAGEGPDAEGNCKTAFVRCMSQTFEDALLKCYVTTGRSGCCSSHSNRRAVSWKHVDTADLGRIAICRLWRVPLSCTVSQ